MLPRSSERVAKVIKLANQIARELDREYVGTEHVLLAILREGTGVGAAVLRGRGVSADRLLAEAEKWIKVQSEDTWVFGRLPGTPHFKNVIARAIEQCQQLGAKEVCTEHILLALAHEQGSVAQKTLESLGIAFADLREDVRALVGGESATG